MMDKFKDLSINKLSLGLSPAMMDKFNDYKNFISEELNFESSKLDIFIQGVSCHYTYYELGLDIDSPNKDLIETSKNYVGVDIGFNSLDFYICVDGSLLDYGIKGFFKKGVCIITNNLKKHIKETYGTDLSDVEVKEILMTYSYKKRGQLIDLSHVIEGYIIEYLTATMDLIEDEYGVQMNKMDNVIIFGGGAQMLKSAQEKLPQISKKIEELYGTDFMLIPKTDAEYYNSIGYTVQSIN